MQKDKKISKAKLCKIYQISSIIKNKFCLTHIRTITTSGYQNFTFELMQQEANNDVIKAIENELNKAYKHNYKIKLPVIPSGSCSKNSMINSTVLCVYEKCTHTVKHNLKVTTEQKAKLLYLGGNKFIRKCIDEHWKKIIETDKLANKITKQQKWDEVTNCMPKRGLKYNEKLKEILQEIITKPPTN